MLSRTTQNTNRQKRALLLHSQVKPGSDHTTKVVNGLILLNAESPDNFQQEPLTLAGLRDQQEVGCVHVYETNRKKEIEAFSFKIMQCRIALLISKMHRLSYLHLCLVQYAITFFLYFI